MRRCPMRCERRPPLGSSRHVLDLVSPLPFVAMRLFQAFQSVHACFLAVSAHSASIRFSFSIRSSAVCQSFYPSSSYFLLVRAHNACEQVLDDSGLLPLFFYLIYPCHFSRLFVLRQNRVQHYRYPKSSHAQQEADQPTRQPIHCASH